LLEAKNVSIIEDDGPNQTLLRKTLHGSMLGSIMHISDNTRIKAHNQASSCNVAK
jgi:hypothetical protein